MMICLLQILIPFFVSFSANVTSKDSNSVKVFTYNVGKGLDDGVIDLLSEVDADIVALQEAYRMFYQGSEVNNSQLASLLSYDYFVSLEGYNQRTYGLTILSKYEIINSTFTKLPDAKNSLPRGFITAQIKINLTLITVITTHLSFPAFYFNRLNQANQIIDAVNFSVPTIVLGDFNTPNSIFDITYWRLFTTFHDAWISSGKPPFAGKTWHVSFPILRVDYIFVNDYCTVVKGSAELYENELSSDHKGFMVKLQFVKQME